MSRLRLHIADPQLAALKAALRATIVTTAVLAFTKLVLDDDTMAMFAGFGSVALLGLVDFGGPRRQRVGAYLCLAGTGAALILLGTVVTGEPWLAAATTALVAFVVLFSGIVNGYAAAGGFGALLLFFVAVMLPAPLSELPARLEGWALACAVSVPAALYLWPVRPRDRLRSSAAEACRALSECVAADASGDESHVAATFDKAVACVDDLRRQVAALPYQPTGATGRNAALARVVTDIGWIKPFLRPSRDAGGSGQVFEELGAKVSAAVVQVLQASAVTLEGGADRPDLDRLERARIALWRALDDLVEDVGGTRDDQALAAAVDEVFRFRLLSYGARHIGAQSLAAAGEPAPDPDDLAPPGTGPAARDGHGLRASPRALRPALAAARREAASHVTIRSVWFRNSLRGAVALSIAVLIAQQAGLQHAFWVTLGTLSVLRSSAVGTGSTVLRAMAGTIAGIVVGGVVIALVGGDDVVMWAILPPAVLVAMYAPRRLSLVATQAAFTVFVLVFFDLIQPVRLNITVIRVEDVAIGCAIALGVGLLLWPRGAAAAVRRAVAAAYSEGVDYMAGSMDALFEGAGSDRLEAEADEARGSGRRLDDAFHQYVAERSPGHLEIDSLIVLIAGATRLRFIGHTVRDSQALWHLSPVSGGSDSLALSRQALDADLQAMRTWYRALGDAVLGAGDPPTPPPRPQGAGGQSLRWLHRATSPGQEAELRIRVATAWVGEHLDVLHDVQPRLSEAAGAAARTTG